LTATLNAGTVEAAPFIVGADRVEKSDRYDVTQNFELAVPLD
jgi:hypothetical protein